MKTLELAQDGQSRVVAMIFDPGDDPIDGLAKASARYGLDAAHFTGIGAFRSVTVGWFDLDAADYRRIDVSEQVEVLSLVGDITTADLDSEDPKVHAHVVLGRSDGSTVGGHLLSGRVRPTLEIIVTETSGRLRRRHDPATGLALIDLDRSDVAMDRDAGMEVAR